jgi:crotonobetainyl-CoA:carnitine CoA-transferase CaiB-like acyl-CoA transferase
MALKSLKGLNFQQFQPEITPAESISQILNSQGSQILRVEQNFKQYSDVKLQFNEPFLNFNIKNSSVREFVRKDLVPLIDIIFESFRPGVMESLELGPEDIHAINPKVIYVRISGFGRDP